MEKKKKLCSLALYTAVILFLILPSSTASAASTQNELQMKAYGDMPTEISTSNSSAVINTATDTITADVPSSIASTPSVQSASHMKTYAYMPTGMSADNYVAVIDTATDTITAKVPILYGVYGVAVNPSGTKVYMTSLSDQKVLVFDTATNNVTAIVPAVRYPTGIAVTPDGTKVYVANFGDENTQTPDNTVTVIDAATNKVVAKVTVGSAPLGIAVTPDGSKVYVVNELNDFISVIDTTTDTVTDSIPIGYQQHFGVAFNPAGTKAYVTAYAGNDAYNVCVIDTATKAVTRIPIEDTSVGAAVSPDGSKAYVTCRNNKVVVIDTASNTVLTSIGASCRGGVSITPDGKKVYVGSYSDNNISVINASTGNVTLVPVSRSISFGQFITTIPVQEGANLYLSNLAPDSKNYGSKMTYTLYYSNFGDAAANNVILEDRLNNSISFISASDGGVYDSSTGTVRWNIGSVNSTGHGYRTLNVSIPKDLYGTVIVNNANISTTDPEVRYDDNEAQAQTKVIGLNLPQNVGIEPNFGGIGTPSVYWLNDITFSYTSKSNADFVSIYIQAFNGNISSKMSGGPIYWTYTTKLWPLSGFAKVSFTPFITPHHNNTNKPIANFSADPESGFVPQLVQFTDRSINATGWIWDFGDGYVSTERNTSHIYKKPGSYNVTLTASNEYGKDSKVKKITVYVIIVDTSKPVADFSADPQSGYAPLTVKFTDKSKNANDWSWDFGDGGTSISRNTSHTYNNAGIYTVTLTVKNGFGTNSTTKQINVVEKTLEKTLPVADFRFEVGQKCRSLDVTFIDESQNATGWSWDFGDGGTSTQRNPPPHTYKNAGIYTVTLTASNENGTNTAPPQPIPVESNNPEAAFSADPESGSDPLVVRFTDESISAKPYGTSINNIEWSWDFGDGSPLSTEQNTNHTFFYNGQENPSVYIVTLTVKNECGKENPTSKKISVKDINAPIADFIADPQSGDAPLTVKFTDNSTNATGWSWDFGDGGTSTQRNTSHTYNNAGSYTVNLTASNEYGKDSEEKEITVNDKEDKENVPESVSLYIDPAGYIYDIDTGNRIGNATVWLQRPDSSGGWENVPTGENPPVSQPDTNPLISDKDGGYQWDVLEGSYRVHVEAPGYEPKNSIVVAIPPPVTDLHVGLHHINDPNIPPILPLANFSIDVSSGYAPLAVQFTDLSENAIGWNWEFGDGTSSIDKYPSHTYSAPGTYTVSLTASNGNGVDSKTGTIDVQAVPIYPIANFICNTTEGYAPLSVQFTDSSENVNGITWDFGDGTSSIDKSPMHTYSVAGNYLVTLTVSNDNGTDSSFARINVSENNVIIPPPTINSITVPLDSVKVNTSMTASTNVTYLGSLSDLTAEWNWGDGSTSEPQASSNFVASHVYNSVGVYTIAFTLKDKNDGIYTQTSPNYVVVYDPQGGFVTGGGWIDSPAGAYVSDTNLVGTANFGFVSKYQKEAKVPTGVTEFNFQVADLHFHSESYDWLVVAGARAQYKGTGTINGQGQYGFILTAIDGDVNGGGSTDKLRIKIWDKTTGNAVYDNMIGAEDTADPTTVIQKGSITVHKDK